MPEICRFYGIVIRMEYSGHEARIEIRTFAVISGRLPGRALGLVAEWASLHQDELLRLWSKAQDLEPLDKIDPVP